MLGAFAILAGFVVGLGYAMRLFNADVLKALPGLTGLLDQLDQMALSFAAIKGLDLLTMFGGFLIVAGFVAALGWALSGFNVQVLQSLGPLSDLLATITTMALSFANMDLGQLLKMGLALALIVGFVWLLSAAIDVATPGLIALAEVLKGLNGVMDKLSAAFSALGSMIGTVVDKIGGAIGTVGDFLFGGPSIFDLAQQAAMKAAPGPAPSSGAAAALQSPLSAAGLAGPASAGHVDQSVNVQGGIAVNISAEKLQADSAQMLSDQVIQKLQEKLGALRSEQDFRSGIRSPAPA
jgi:hypothetical protein